MVYLASKRNGGELKYFPVWQYVVPASIGMILEVFINSAFIGICNAIAISSVLSSLQDERIFRDSLTGLYNRSYLEEIKNMLEKKHNSYISGVMLDLNGFKQINDTYGHAEGDQALITAANIIKNGVGSYGDAIRYAGDEFIIMINSWDEKIVNQCVTKIENDFKYYNNQKRKPYNLTVSMGYAMFNPETQSVNEFLNTIDKNMYDNKQKFHEMEKQGNN
ncbi:MAG: GGDEF domain-containing protein [Erysipelotrichaceae bacterium]|nr:GGDEF domain-containing protein [Erysipelotrichaceae bacterium]